MPDRLDGVHHRARVTRPETDDPTAEVALLEHLAVQRASSALEPHPPAGPHPLPGMHQRLPALVVDARHEQHFDRSAAGLALANQPRREHPGVVEHHQVAGRQEPGDVPNRRVHHGAGAPVEDQQARRSSLVGRKLRHEIRREVEREVGDVHRNGRKTV